MEYTSLTITGFYCVVRARLKFLGKSIWNTIVAAVMSEVKQVLNKINIFLKSAKKPHYDY